MGAAVRRRSVAADALCMLAMVTAAVAAVPEGLRSELYPTDWQPGVADDEGPDRTQLVNGSADGMRQTAAVLVGPDRSDRPSWHDDATGPGMPLTRDVDEPTRTLHVADPAAFAVGDWGVLVPAARER